jgi:hypothetical protein
MIGFFRVTLARWAANVHTLLIQGRGPGEQPADDIEAYQPLGLRTRPIVARSTEALVIELPNGERVAFVCDKGLSSTPPEEGETQLHGLKETSAVVWIRANGDIQITPKNGRQILLGDGATKKVNREGDLTSNGTLIFNPGAGGASLAWLPPGATVPPVVAPVINIPLSGLTGAGSVTVRGAD